jgi:hypothetical protein
MSMPTVLILKGYRFFFVSLDRGEPIHIHIEKNNSYAKFWLNPTSLSRSKGFKAQEISEIRRIIEKHEKIFIKRWNEFFA